MFLFKTFFMPISIIFLLFMIACSNDPTSAIPTEGSIKLSIKGVSNAAKTSLNKSVNNVVITSARIVIDEVEFESEADSVDFEFEEPFVQDLALNSSLQEINTVQVPFGTYEEMEVEIDELEDKDSPAFNQNPDLQNLSIRVEGFLGNDSSNTFIFTSDLSETQEREFDPPLVLDETSPSTNVVITIDTATWFVDDNGDPLDPTVGSNRDDIEDNIKASIKIFEDEDDDGEDDDGDDD